MKKQENRQPDSNTNRHNRDCQKKRETGRQNTDPHRDKDKDRDTETDTQTVCE